VKELSAAARAKGRRFGIKLSNTLANVNPKDRLPGAERYMSGRALFPITIRLAAELAAALPDFSSPFSFCGGVSAFNAADLIRAGLGPLTIVTDILKPGGYLRMAQVAQEAALALSGAAEVPDPAALAALAEASLSRPEYRADWKAGRATVPGALPLYDCFAAPCVQACPVNQKVPAYLAAQGAGKSAEALAVVLSDNPLPHVTGKLCDHVCQERCSRLDYEGPVRIRDVKLEAAEGAQLEATPLSSPVPGSARTAIVGAGPAGLACAHFLALMGRPVTVFDARQAPGGVPANVIPGFRIGREAIAADVDRIASLGVEFVFGARLDSHEELKARGFGNVFLAVGAQAARPLPLKGSGMKTMSALDFLSAFGEGREGEFAGLRNVLVVGGGNTACDAVRAASRIPGLASVALSYRRTRAEMPADREELGYALAEASALMRSTAPAQASATANDPGSAVLYELSLPESVAPGSVTLRRMKLGPADESGRRSPKSTKESFVLPCDLIVSAVGEEPDRRLLKGFGVAFGEDGFPDVAPVTLESKVSGVYVGGDARLGPGSIIAAVADGRKAARAILAASGLGLPSADYEPPALAPGRLARRGLILPSLSPGDPGFAEREAERCLACDSACLRCVEVCPNRANLYLEIGKPFAQDAQILHVDALCNECGNCGFFCPWEGEPFRGKPTLFDSVEELEKSANAGFAFVAGKGAKGAQPALVLRNEPSGPISRLDHASWNGASSLPGLSSMTAIAREVYRRHAYLLEGQR
jgi:putative selenate reductase